MLTERLEAARRLAAMHFNSEPELRRVFLLKPAHDEEHSRDPIQLLEVVEGTFETEPEAVTFPANSGLGVEFPFSIIEISPRQLEGIGETIRFSDRMWKVAQELPNASAA